MTVAGAGLPAVFSRVGRFVPTSLLDTPGWERVAERVGELPALPTMRNAGFEFRLSDPEPAADFIVAPGRAGELVAHYLRRGRQAAPRSPAASLGALLERMRRCDSDLRWLRGVMLEYDVAGISPGGRPEPGVFLGLRPGFRAGAALRGRPAAELLAETLTSAVGWDPEPDESEALAGVVAQIPGTADAIQVGAMPGRTPRLLRITVAFARAEELPRFLEDIGWRGPLEKADLVRRRIGAAADCIFAASFGLGAHGVVPRLGLEVYLRKGAERLATWTDTTAADWLPVLARAEADGWCIPDKVEGLRRVPGLHQIAGRNGTGLLYLGVNHLKVSLGQAGVTSKAYVGMRFLPPSRPSA